MNSIEEKIKDNMQVHNKNLSKYACPDSSSLRLEEIDEDFRTPFFRDIDKIIYSLAYVRYIDKTQVFSNVENDMISKRMTHVQMVSKIARTIGRALNLNEDLIEAASLGHDLGHVPFGHIGEKILNEISLKYNEGYFNHNVQSVRTLMYIENYGKGSNISVQVLDAILAHNGEMLGNKYYPKQKTADEFYYEYKSSYTDQNILKSMKPMTLEGCVVRISDIIAYIGRDIEDAIRIGKISKNDIPNEIVETFGITNSDIVNTIVMDIIENSFDRNYISMSDEIFSKLNKLINFNYEKIYLKANSKSEIQTIEKMFNKLFDLYYKHIIKHQTQEDIYQVFLNDMSNEYKLNNTPARIVIDYISGMTDDYFKNQYKKYFE